MAFYRLNSKGASVDWKQFHVRENYQHIFFPTFCSSKEAKRSCFGAVDNVIIAKLK
jgi:hypothetical protein